MILVIVVDLLGGGDAVQTAYSVLDAEYILIRTTNSFSHMIEDLGSGKVRQFHWDEVDGLPHDGNAALLDVRTEWEYQRGHLDGFRNVPLDDLREHLDELDRSKPVYVNCQTGLRSYLACRLLTQYGFSCSHLSGGYSFYQVVTKEQQTARSAYPCGMEKL